MTLFQWIVVPAAAAAAVYQLALAFSHRARLLSGVVWAAIFGSVACCVLWPQVPSEIAHWLGIGRGADLVTYGTAVLVVCTLRWAYSRYRYLEVVYTELVRELAIERARFGSSGAERPGAQDLTRKTA